MKKKIFAVILGLQILMLSGCGVGATGISKEEFDKLSMGMSISEVEEIIGGKGTMISEQKSTIGSHHITTWIYEYQGERCGSAKITYMLDVDYDDMFPTGHFQLSGKEQNGLI